MSWNLLKAQEMFGNHFEIFQGDLVEVKDLKAFDSDVTHLFAAHEAGSDSDERSYELVDFGGMDKALDSIPEEQKTHIIYMSSSIDYEPTQPSSCAFNQPLYWRRLTDKMVQNTQSFDLAYQTTTK